MDMEGWPQMMDLRATKAARMRPDECGHRGKQGCCLKSKTSECSGIASLSLKKDLCSLWPRRLCCCERTQNLMHCQVHISLYFHDNSIMKRQAPRDPLLSPLLLLFSFRTLPFTWEHSALAHVLCSDHTLYLHLHVEAPHSFNESASLSISLHVTLTKSSI